MLTSGIKFINYKTKYNKKNLKKLYRLLDEKNSSIVSLSKDYKDGFDPKN